MGHVDSLGVGAAYLWSLWALFFGTAGMAGMRMTFSLLPDAAPSAEHVYLEVAAAVTVFILAGRYFEARAKTRSGAALRALLDMGAKDVAVLRQRPAKYAFPQTNWRSATSSSCGRGRRSPPMG